METGESLREQTVPTIDEDEEEKKNFLRIINAFKYYRPHSMLRLNSAEKYYVALPKHHRQLLPNFAEHLRKVFDCINQNSQIIKMIIAHTDNMFENKENSLQHQLNGGYVQASEFDMDKVKSTLKQFVRDWSEEGSEERAACYQPIIDEILSRFPANEFNPSQISVLVPGAGLGRLAYEIAKRGFICQGNEFSLFMLFASNFILNKCKGTNIHALYPWVHQFCNNKSSEDQIRGVLFPDVSPASLPENSNFSMAAGDFLEIYMEPESWDCIASVFFLDTAHNIIAYLETIWHILRPGGYLINFGPLLYHFADMPNEPSIELSYDDVRKVMLSIGFKIVREEFRTASYTQNPRSMLQYMYECAFFVAQKPIIPDEEIHIRNDTS